MNNPKIIFLVFIVSITISSILFSVVNNTTPNVELLLDKSAPHIGADTAHKQGLSGEGIVIAVIDTGVDFTHPDLNGFSSDGKVIGGYNFVDETKLPTDRNGHGTQVAGIIAADGKISGIAPKAKILSYKVSDSGESVSSELIVEAIKKAIQDQADIINISLGVNKTNSKIDSAVNQAVDDGIFVIVAAGNDGPRLNTIGSPGKNINAITVGATYNNITSSLVSTLIINDKQYQVIPMLGVDSIAEPIEGKIVDGVYAREYDFDMVDATDSILLVQRGSDKKDETVYFTEKEFNSANAGAKAIIVYNNQPGMYLGDVSEAATIENYKPRIPIVSLSQKDGIELKEMLLNEKPVNGSLNVFYNPDYVAFFSSRGPLIPLFYIKPDIVAPGAFVNSTDVGGTYNFSSGTSFATPHVSGAAALLLEKYPDLQPGELKAILTSTTVPVTDAYGNDFSIADAGAGRLDIENALNAEIIIEPAYAIITFSPAEKQQTHQIMLKGIMNNKEIENISVEIKAPKTIQTDHTLKNNTLTIHATIINDTKYDRHEGTIIIKHNAAKYRIPIIFHYVEASVNIHEDNGLLNFEIIEPKDWKYAKIIVINKKTDEFFTTSLTPKRDSRITVNEPGEYWIETSISTYNKAQYAYDTVRVNVASSSSSEINNLETVFAQTRISEKPIYIILTITALVAVVGIRFKTRKNSCKNYY